MDLQTRKIKFIQNFLKVENEDLISRLEEGLNSKTEILEHDEFEQRTLKEFNARIDQSVEDSANGRLVEESELKSEISKWS